MPKNDPIFITISVKTEPAQIEISKSYIIKKKIVESQQPDFEKFPVEISTRGPEATFESIGISVFLIIGAAFLFFILDPLMGKGIALLFVLVGLWLAWKIQKNCWIINIYRDKVIVEEKPWRGSGEKWEEPISRYKCVHLYIYEGESFGDDSYTVWLEHTDKRKSFPIYESGFSSAKNERAYRVLVEAAEALNLPKIDDSKFKKS